MNSCEGFVVMEKKNFEAPYHDATLKKMNYRFVNAEGLSDRSLDVFRNRADSMVFEGDLSGMFIEITSGGIRSQYVEALDVRLNEGF